MQLFPTIIVNLAALSSGMGYGFSAIALPQLKAVVTNAFGRNEFARTYYQPFTIDDESGSWIGTFIFSSLSNFGFKKSFTIQIKF